MPDADRTLAERIHALVTGNAPGLLPKTWYGMPADAAILDDGRYAVLGLRSSSGPPSPEHRV